MRAGFKISAANWQAVEQISTLWPRHGERRIPITDEATRTKRALQALSRWLMLGAVLTAPWLFGSSEPWAYLLISSFSAAACAVWILSEICSRTIDVRASAVTTTLLALIACVALQGIRLPIAIVRLASPLSAGVWQQAGRTVQELPSQGAFLNLSGLTSGFAALSLSPKATGRSLYLFVAYVATFLVMANTIRFWDHLRRSVAVIVVLTLVMAFFAVLHRFSGSHEIYWLHEPRYGGDVFGPFTNRNHLAAHLNMVFGLAIGLFLSSRRFHQILAWPDWRDRIAWLYSRQAAATTLHGFVIILLAGAVAVSLSRGALLSLVATLGIFGIVILRHNRGGPRTQTAFIAAVLLLGVTVAWFGRDEMAERFARLANVVKDPSSDYRFIVTLDTLRMSAASPVFGVGFGAFRHVYPVFQTPSLASRWLHAHNDWAQLFAEGGIVGALLFIASLILWVRLLSARFPGASKRARFVVLGIVFGLTTLALHSFVDYSLHKPANAFLCAAMAGMAVAGVHMERGGAAAAPAPVPKSVEIALRLLGIIAVLGLTVMVQDSLRQLRGELAFARFLYLEKIVERHASPQTTQEAISGADREADLVALYAGQSPDELSEIAAGLMRWSSGAELERSRVVQLRERAAYLASLAVTGAHSDYLTWLWLARSQMLLGRWDETEVCLDRARGLVKRGGEVRMFELEEQEELDEDDPSVLVGPANN